MLYVCLIVRGVSLMYNSVIYLFTYDICLVSNEAQSSSSSSSSSYSSYSQYGLVPFRVLN